MVKRVPQNVFYYQGNVFVYMAEMLRGQLDTKIAECEFVHHDLTREFIHHSLKLIMRAASKGVKSLVVAYIEFLTSGSDKE